MGLKGLPIGIENFAEMREANYYYVDKTGMIIDMLKSRGKVNLFTRPRRFGKTLNMSMLKSFFEVGCDEKLLDGQKVSQGELPEGIEGIEAPQKKLFDGLKVSQEKELCEQHMGKYPVIFITLKSVAGITYMSARNALSGVIGDEASRCHFLLDSDKLTEAEKREFAQLMEVSSPEDMKSNKNMARYAMNDDVLCDSLRVLSKLLYKHYGRKAIVLIDEYDVPLDKAFQNGFYDEMVSLIRNLLGNVLKTNDYLEFAVLTGCLRISKESIFTGLNNLRVHTIADVNYDEYFGFTDEEVQDMLAYYGLSERYDTVREWYDGYRFGDMNVYCPWDVINYCFDVRSNPKLVPKNYWANTSGNALVRRFIDKADYQTKSELEQLISGGGIVKKVREELTYAEIDSSINNMWSVLYTTGYLTRSKSLPDRKMELVIPNREIHELFEDQIWDWFTESLSDDATELDELCGAVTSGDATTIERIFSDYLWKMISIHDTARPKEQREAFYHGLLLGLLGHRSDWIIKSGVESGYGYTDILIEAPRVGAGVIIEVKYAADGNLEAACGKAFEQIDTKRYRAVLEEDGMRTIITYAVACYKKRCKVEVCDDAII